MVRKRFWQEARQCTTVCHQVPEALAGLGTRSKIPSVQLEPEHSVNAPLTTTHSLPAETDPTSPCNVVVIIPALNEEASIGKVVRAIPAGVASVIIVVDNGSDDNTAAEAMRAGATVLTEPRRGYGYACLKGIAHALDSSPDIIAFVDGDLSDYPEDLPAITQPIIEEGYDLVVGSRLLGAREPGALLPQALFGNILACFLIRLFWGEHFTDLGPFRAIRTEALKKLNMRDKTFGWTVEMQVKAAKLGLRCVEVPARYRKRIGTSKVTGTVSGTIKASTKILYTIFRYLFVKI